MPRFVRDLSENGKEILSMNEVIAYLVKSYQPIVDEMDLMQVCVRDIWRQSYKRNLVIKKFWISLKFLIVGHYFT